MVMASASNQTVAYYSSTNNSPVQRSDIHCNASDKGKRIKKHRDQNLPNFGMTNSKLFKDVCSRGHSTESCEQFKNHVFSLLDARRISLQGPVIKKEVIKGTPRAEDTKKWNLKRDDQKLKEKLPWVWDLEDLCVFPQVEIPVEFKIPDFVKYDGPNNPKFHLKAYWLTMGKWGQNEKLFLAHFHFSLTGIAFQWYIRLAATAAIVFIPQLPKITATATVTRWCSALLIFLLATPPPLLCFLCSEVSCVPLYWFISIAYT
ncbi:uncharacterized protein G2W53_035202 [Senna tora]|uniref:Uncharacterized protein n=1 Tax=Senna tora TaxID=362788 RepID=A0A834W904_9FABA|nr:uncharacterized protein G2W53_035202 [Senna tora]